MRNVLLAFDGSECSLRAVDYVGMQFSGLSGLTVTLFHVLPNLPPRLWDDGHILSDAEREERCRVVEKWLTNQRLRVEPLFAKARGMLIARGFTNDQIETKTTSDVANTVDSILEEANGGGYSTLVIGRCGLSAKQRFFTGSTTTAIVNRGAGLAICIVE